MKSTEKEAARALRFKGLAISEIASTLKVSKASVSVWVRDIVLTSSQRKKINSNGFSVSAIEKRRVHRIANTHRKHREVIDAAKLDIPEISKRELFLIGIALYWGEGGKTNVNLTRISNADPVVIKIMMRFFRELCAVPADKFNGQVHIFSHLNAKAAEQYWSAISGIPIRNFYKTQSKPSSASKDKRHTLPNGTFQIYISDTKLQLKIKGWIEALAAFADT
jgi:hypothetical protein